MNGFRKQVLKLIMKNADSLVKEPGLGIYFEKYRHTLIKKSGLDIFREGRKYTCFQKETRSRF